MHSLILHFPDRVHWCQGTVAGGRCTKLSSKKTVTSADSQDRVKIEYAAHVNVSFFSVIDPFELHLVLKASFVMMTKLRS